MTPFSRSIAVKLKLKLKELGLGAENAGKFVALI